MEADSVDCKDKVIVGGCLDEDDCFDKDVFCKDRITKRYYYSEKGGVNDV